LDKGNKLKKSHRGLPREKALCVCGKERRRRREFEEEFFSSYVWRGVHEKVCVQ